MAALYSFNANTSSRTRLLSASSIVEPTHNKPHSNVIAIARAPRYPSVYARFGRMPAIQGVPQKCRRVKSLCMAADKEGWGEDLERQHTDSPTTVVNAFFAAINHRDVNALSDLITDGCIFNDLAFPKPFEGRQAVIGFLKNLMEAMGKGMKFVVDSVSEGDSFSVGVMWHLEWEGKIFPSSKGCSFCHCEVQGQRLLIRYVQEFIESPIKPGELALIMLKTITSTFDQFPMLAQSII